MELTQLTFAVDTTPLDTADKKIRGLGEALKTLERPMSAIAKDSSTVASGVEEVASKAQAAGSKLKGVEASLEKVSTAMKIFRGETVDVGDEVVNLGSSFTKSQANFLALQKQLGASADQLKSFAKEFNDFNRITSANTFDNSIAGVQRLTKDIRELSEVNKLAAANTTLTRDQVMNLVRDTERLQQAMQSMGKSNAEINASIAQQTQQYVNLASEKNKLIAQTKAMEDSARAAASAELERAKASAYVTKEAEKLAFVNAQLKEGFTVGSANALYKYKEALDLTAMSADQAKSKLAAFGEQLKSKQSSSPFAALVKDAEETRKQVNHLARDVSVQLGDIAISLAGGQNPFMVMIQQGDQIRGALLRAKDQGVDTSQAMKNALGQIATSFVDLGQMVGSFFVGSIESAGNAVKRLVTEKTFLGAAIDTVNAKMIAQGGVSANLASYIQKLGTFFTFLAGTAIVGATLALATFTVAQLAVIKESDNLVRSIHSQGAAFGVSSEEANKMVTSLSSVGVSSSKAAQAMQAMIEGGKQSKESFALVAEAATLMSTYAGISIDKTVKEFDKIADAPSKSLIELGKATGYVTLEMVQEVQQLEKVGATQEAVRRTTEILAEAKKKAAGDIARDLSAVATAWIEIKRTASEAFDAFKNSAVSEGVLNLISEAMKYIAITAYAATAGLKTLAKYLSTADLKEYETYRDEQAKGMYAFIDSLNAAKIAAGGLTAEQKQQNNAALAGAEATEKLNKAISGGAKDNVKAMTQGAYVAARMTEELQKAGQGAVYSAELQKTAVAKFKKEYEELTKVKSGPKPKETFSIATDNTIAETKKSLDTQLKLVKEFENNRRDALKNAYESGIISRGEYLAQETAMTIDAFESQQQVIDKYQQYLDSFNQRRINIIKSYDDAIAKGGNKQELAKQLSNELANLDRAANGASETLDAMRASLSAATDKRFTEAWKESNKALMESKKAYEEFESTINNANQERQSEIQLQIQLSSAHGAEAEAIKASTAAMKSYAPAINKMALELRKAQQEYDNFMNNIDYSDDSKFEAQMLDAARLQKNLAQQRTNYNNAVALARQDAEQAATDASTKYQIEKYNELKGTLSDSIYTAIFEGGKQGGDILKNYLMKEFKNFVITAFIQPVIGSALGSLGISAAGAVAGGAVGSSAVSTITSGLGAASGAATVAGWLGSAGGAISGFTTALTASAQSLIGLTGTTAQMATSLGAAGHTAAAGYSAGANAGMAFAKAVPYVAAGTLALNALGVFRKTTQVDVGLKGTLGYDSNIVAYDRMRKSGTLFSGPDYFDRVRNLDEDTKTALNNSVKNIYDVNTKFAEALGLSAEGIKDITREIRVSTENLTPEQIKEVVDKEFAALNDQIAQAILGTTETVSTTVKELQLVVQGSGDDAYATYQEVDKVVTQVIEKQSEYARAGETASQTLSRLGESLLTVNATFEMLGLTTLEASLKSADAASNFIASFGTPENFQNSIAKYYENFYSESEKAANTTKMLTTELGKHNLVLPKTRKEYRDLVEAQRALGEEGLPALSTLLQLNDVFAQLVPTEKEAKRGLQDLVNTLGISADFMTAEFTPEVESAMQSIGLSAQAMSDTVADVLSSILTGKTPAAEAGTALASAVIDSIYNAIIGSATASIAQAFTQSIIAPIIANIAAGQAALAGIDIASATQVAVAQIDAITQVLASPAFVGAMDSASQALVEIGNAAGNAAGKISSAASSISSVKVGGSGSNTYSGGYGGVQYDAPMPGSFGGTSTEKFVQAGQHGFALEGWQEFQDWVSAHVISSGDTTFAIGGSAPTQSYVSKYINYVSTNLESINSAITEAYKKIGENTGKIGKPKLQGLEAIDEQYTVLFKSLGGDKQQIHVDFFKTRIRELEAINSVFPGAMSEIRSILTAVPAEFGKDPANIKQITDKAKEQVKSILGAIPTLGNEILGMSMTYGPQSIDAAIESMLSTISLGPNGYEPTGLTNFLAEIQRKVANFADPFGEGPLSDSLANATKELDKLNKQMKDWYLAQLRVLATDELVQLQDETQAAIEKTAELKRTGGLEDPVTKLVESYTKKLKNIDDGIGKILTEEINTLLGTKADTTDLDKKLASQLLQRDKLTAPGYLDSKVQELTDYADSMKKYSGIAAQAVADQIQVWADSIGTDMEAYNLSALSNISDIGWMEGYAAKALSEIDRLKNGGLAEDITAINAAIAKTQEETTAAVLAATDPKKRAELEAEIKTYKDGIVGWFKAQAELLSTEMMVDVSKQIKELEATEKGPIQTIKDAIQKYVDDLTALGQLTPENQAKLNKLSGLQLGKARADLYNQLLPDEVVKQNALADLTKQFTDLGQKLPATTADFKTLIDSITDQNLKDKLLELIPAFIGLQAAVESVATSSIEDLTKQFTEAYKSELGRMPDTAGLKYWIDLVQSGTMTMEKAMEAFSEAATGEKLNMRILELTDAEAYLAQVRANELSLLSPTNQELQKRIYALEDELAILEERKGLEQQLLQLLGDTAALRAQELAALDASNRALQQQIYAIEDARAATDKAVAALERATAEQIKQLEKTFTATDLAMQVLEKAVDKEKQRLQDQLKSAQDSSNALKKVFDTLEKAIKSLRAQVDPTAKLAVQEARTVLSSALTSGIASDTTALEDAISVLKADVEQGLYATSYDKSRAFLTLANDLEKLKQNSEPQLTTAEQQVKLAEAQVKQLDDLLEKARGQVSAIRDVDASLFGIDESITAVELAQKQLLSATQAEQEARLQIDKLNEQLLEFKTQVEVLRSIDNSVIDVETAVLGVKGAISTEMKAISDAVAMSIVPSSGVSSPGGGAGAGGITIIPPTTTTPTNTDARKSAIESLYQSYLGRPADAPGLDWYNNSDKTLEQIRDDFIFQTTQGFAKGGYYPGGLALVGEEGPELINFSNPGMVYTAAQSANLMQADNSDLAEELRALRQEVQMLRAEARATAVNTSKTARILDDVTQGGDSLKTTTA